MKTKTVTLSLFLASGLILLILVFYFYLRIYGSGLITQSGGKEFLYVRTHSNFNDLEKNLFRSGFLADTDNFKWVAHLLKFGKLIKPGKYEIENGMSYKKLFRKIQLGDQVPVVLILHNLRLKENLAGFVGKRLEVDSASILEYFNKPGFADSLGFTMENLYCLFLPNSYQFKWNTTANQFMIRMVEEYRRYWNVSRKKLAEEHGLSPNQVIILASIVSQESNKPFDMSLIAGVYLNRLKSGIKLEADPTVVFSNGDFSIRRVTQKYLAKDSPYNTYKYKGLPPGPITMPTEQALEAVLNSPATSYLYFCAKSDFSGNHAFAVTREEHQINARKFHDALNARNIH